MRKSIVKKLPALAIVALAMVMQKTKATQCIGALCGLFLLFPGVTMAQPTPPASIHVTLADHNHLQMSCHSSGARVDVIVNGILAGAVNRGLRLGESGNAYRTPLEAADATPGKNTLTIRLSEKNPEYTLDCQFYDWPDMTNSEIEKGLKPLSSFAVDQHAFAGEDSLTFTLIVDSKGYYPALEPLFDEHRALMTALMAPYNFSFPEEALQTKVVQLREKIIATANEAEARKSLEETIDKLTKAKVIEDEKWEAKRQQDAAAARKDR